MRTGPFGTKVAAQARQAVEEADLVLFVVDAKVGVTPGDEELAEILRSSRRDVLVIANKLDDPRRDAEALEFHRLVSATRSRSALHGHGTGDLLDDVVERLRAAVSDRLARRPFGWRSSDARTWASRRSECAPRPRARDRVRSSRYDATRSTRFSARRASLRARGHRRASTKTQAAPGNRVLLGLRALEAAERADVALVVVDASEGVVDQDLAVADAAREARCATVVILSKWDVTEVRIEEVRPHLETRLRQRPPILAVSSLTGRGLERLLDTVEDVFSRYASRIPTAS